MSGDDGSVKNTLGSESSSSSTSAAPVCGDASRRKKEYGRKDRKTIRILTVVAYILCVSMAAVVLSTYYVFLWNPGPVPTEKPPRLSHFQNSGTGNRMMAYTGTPVDHSAIPLESNRYHGNRKFSPAPHNDQIQYQTQLSNTSPYQHRQIPTPLPLLMTTHFLTTVPPGVPTTKPTTTSPTPPFFKLKLNPMV